jgi:hypothetical protein
VKSKNYGANRVVGICQTCYNYYCPSLLIAFQRRPIEVECLLTGNHSRGLKRGGTNGPTGTPSEGSRRIICQDINDIPSVEELHKILAKDP